MRGDGEVGPRLGSLTWEFDQLPARVTDRIATTTNTARTNLCGYIAADLEMAHISNQSRPVSWPEPTTAPESGGSPVPTVPAPSPQPSPTSAR